MGEMEKSGANSETVMQGLRKALKSAAKDGKPLNQALTELQDTIENGKDGMDGLTAAYELFGKSGDQIYGAVKNGSLDFRNLGKDASDAAGSVAGTFEETLDPIDQWQTTLNQLKLTGAELGATIGELLQPVLEKVAEVAQSLREKWEALSPAQQNMIVEIAGIVAVVGPIVAIIGSIITGIGGLITAITTVAGVLGVAASTVGIVIAAITAIIAIIVLCITHWDKIKETVANVVNAIKDYVSQLKEKVQQKFEEIKQQIAQKIDSVKSDMSSKWNQIKSDVTNKVVNMKNDVVNKLVELKNSAVEKLNDIKSKFTEKFNDIKDKVKGVVDDIKGFFEGMKLKIPKPELPALPHFSLSGEFSLNPPSVPHLSVDWYKKAMVMPYMFTTPTVMQTPYGAVGAGEAGHEIMYGKQALMRDIANASSANNANLVNALYRAMVAALKTADITVDISGREFKRVLREAGVKS
jgi:phage-related minor tail protein